METYKDAAVFIAELTKKLVASNKIREALNLLEENYSPAFDNIGKSVILNKSQLTALQNELIMGIITPANASAQRTKIGYNVLQIIDQVADEMEINRLSGSLGSGIYRTTSEENLEKILGPVNHLVKINWLQKAIRASRSVCQVVRADGQKGTGFILQNGYLMTNFHVLPSKAKAAASKIVFDYEEDLFGNNKRTSEFFLDPDDISCSPVAEYDYTYIRIKDNSSNPLSQWGNLELDTFSEPQVDHPVTIIQHPLGQTKQIALTANKIIGINGHRLLYQTDTEKGSSGSPVFSNDWKVIALHHAGKTEEDGGLVIDPQTGERRGANEGILIKSIVQHNPRIN